MSETSIRYKLLGFEGNITYKLLTLKGAIIRLMNVYFKANRASIRPTYANVGIKISDPLPKLLAVALPIALPIAPFYTLRDT
jgi:hypothetical protein